MCVYMHMCLYVCVQIVFDYPVILENLAIMESRNTHNPAIPKIPSPPR